jgi:hypothetical protein
MNKVAGFYAGWQTPQLQMGLTPLEWGLEIGVSNQHFAVRVGPLAVAVWYRFASPFTCDCVVEK